MSIRVNVQPVQATTPKNYDGKKKLLLDFFNRYYQKDTALRDDHVGHTLFFIDLFVTQTIATDQPGYRIRLRRSGTAEYCPSRLADCFFRQLNDFMAIYAPTAYYSPSVALFYDACTQLNLVGYRFDLPYLIDNEGRTAAERFNGLVSLIREKGLEPAFKKQMSDERHHGLRRFLSLTDYVEALFENVRSRLVAIRLDLKYKSEHVRSVTFEQARADFNHLLNNTRNKPSLFSGMVGYVAKLECGNNGGYHVHLLLFFVDDHLNDDCKRGQSIGEYWQDVITGGRGRYFNANDPKHMARQHRLAIGRIEYHDAEKRYNLLYILAYFCKETQKVQIKPTKRSKLLRRGEMPAARTNLSGRPRLVDVEPFEYLRWGKDTNTHGSHRNS